MHEPGPLQQVFRDLPASQPSETPAPTVDFGFETVPLHEKTRRVQDIFHRVASRYDLMNDLMSAGIHRVWKRAMVAQLPARHRYHHVDIAGGTGDVARLAQQRMTALGCLGQVTVCDLNESMLRQGQQQDIRSANLTSSLRWVCGNAETLPLPDHSADFYTVAFGLRNMTHRDAALREAFRVLKPGGMFLCLEFSHVQPRLIAEMYRLYSFHVIPRLGALVAGDRAAYDYLIESIARFPSQETLAQMMREAGFARVRYQNFLHGVAALHTGWKTSLSSHSPRSLP